MKIVCLSDIHGNLPEIPECDLLLIAGDLCPIHGHDVFVQAAWINVVFHQWIINTPAKERIVVAGNHDFVFEKGPGLISSHKGWTYLQDNSTEFEDLRFLGTPWQPRFFDWAFNLDEPDLEKKWAQIPDDTDILVVHGPPHGYGDHSPYPPPKGEHCGSPSLLDRIMEIRPILVTCGHIHASRGVYQIGDTIVANASLVNEKYQPVHEIIEINL